MYKTYSPFEKQEKLVALDWSTHTQDAPGDRWLSERLQLWLRHTCLGRIGPPEGWSWAEWTAEYPAQTLVEIQRLPVARRWPWTERGGEGNRELSGHDRAQYIVYRFKVMIYQYSTYILPHTLSPLFSSLFHPSTFLFTSLSLSLRLSLPLLFSL